MKNKMKKTHTKKLVTSLSLALLFSLSFQPASVLASEEDYQSRTFFTDIDVSNMKDDQKVVFDVTISPEYPLYSKLRDDKSSETYDFDASSDEDFKHHKEQTPDVNRDHNLIIDFSDYDSNEGVSNAINEALEKDDTINCVTVRIYPDEPSAIMASYYFADENETVEYLDAYGESTPSFLNYVSSQFRHFNTLFGM